MRKGNLFITCVLEVADSLYKIYTTSMYEEMSEKGQPVIQKHLSASARGCLNQEQVRV